MATNKTVFCCECQFWLSMEKELGKPYGQCDHPVVEDQIMIEKTQSTIEDAIILTYKNFGCIYNVPKHGNVVAKINLVKPIDF